MDLQPGNMFMTPILSCELCVSCSDSKVAQQCVGVMQCLCEGRVFFLYPATRTHVLVARGGGLSWVVADRLLLPVPFRGGSSCCLPWLVGL